MLLFFFYFFSAFFIYFCHSHTFTERNYTR